MKKYILSVKYLIFTILFLSCFGLTACKASSAVTVTIAGKEVTIKGKLQTSMDNGLATIDANGKETALDTYLDGREVSFEPVYLGDSQYSQNPPVYVNCFNIESSRQSVYNCSILLIHYDTMLDNADTAPVLIDGIDFWGMTEDEALDALKALKRKVDYDTLHKDHYNSFKTGKTTWTIQSMPGSFFDESSQDPQKATVEFDDDTYYISSVELSIADALSITVR